METALLPLYPCEELYAATSRGIVVGGEDSEIP
jgi:hypothetical protein